MRIPPSLFLLCNLRGTESFQKQYLSKARRPPSCYINYTIQRERCFPKRASPFRPTSRNGADFQYPPAPPPPPLLEHISARRNSPLSPVSSLAASLTFIRSDDYGFGLELFLREFANQRVRLSRSFRSHTRENSRIRTIWTIQTLSRLSSSPRTSSICICSY